MPAVCFLSNCYPREGSAQLKAKIHSRRRQCTFEEQLRNLEDYRFIATMFSCIIASIIGLSGSIRVITFTVSIIYVLLLRTKIPAPAGTASTPISSRTAPATDITTY